MATKTAAPKKAVAPNKAAAPKKSAARKVARRDAGAKKAVAAAVKKAARRGGRTDYRAARARRQGALTDEQHKTYEQAYQDAGRAMDLAELIYVARTDSGLTQTQLAAAMGTSQSAVAAWENGARVPGVEALERMAAACGKRLRIAIA